MIAESYSHAHSVFTTLTYSEEELPENGSLSKRDAQLFLMRLRNELRRKEGRSFRYYLCGEYGDKTLRPHYHAILFGLSMADMAKIQNCWSKGITQTAEAQAHRFAYTAKYLKKTIIKQGVDKYDDNRCKEFALMSKNPGLGRDTIRRMAGRICAGLRKKQDLRLNGCMRVNGKKWYFDKYTRSALMSDLVDMGIPEETVTRVVGVMEPDEFGPWREPLVRANQQTARSISKQIESRERLRSVSRRSL